MGVFYALLVFSIALSALFICLQKENQPLLGFFLKGASTISIIVLALYSCIKTGIILDTFGLLFIIGLLFCLFGDVLLHILEFKCENKYGVITLGSYSFFMAHIFFSLAIISNLTQTWVISICSGFGILMVLIIYFMQKPLKINYSKSLASTLVYTFGLSTALALSFANAIISGFSLFSTLLFVGFVLFFASDLVLSMIYFKEKSSRKLYYLNYALYYMAIIFIAASFIAF